MCLTPTDSNFNDFCLYIIHGLFTYSNFSISRVEVRRSSIDADNAGEGLYARIPISEGQIIALFNGVRLMAARNNSLDFVEDLTFEYRFGASLYLALKLSKNMLQFLGWQPRCQSYCRALLIVIT